MPAHPMLEYLWIVPLLPLLVSAINGILGAKWPNKYVTLTAISSMDMKMVMILRLKMKANTPSPNKIALRIM